MAINLILLLLLNFNQNSTIEFKKNPFWTIGELTSASLIIEGKVIEIDSQVIILEINEVLKGNFKSRQVKLANNFYTNYGWERRNDKGIGFWKIGEEKIFFLRKAYYEDDLIDKNIYRIFNRHGDSERRIIVKEGIKKIELSYGSWVNSALNKKYEDLEDLNNEHRKRIFYSYSEMKEAIRYFSRKKKKIQRKVKQNIRNQQTSKKVKRKWRYLNWNGIISNKELIKLSKKNPSFERLLDEYFNNVYKITW